ncbi:DUF4279 domain-containing protein [Bacillus sp. FJAT-49736]|uniref:DUF4279 domain-containing protein n=1 Tax=Bacillus sp. FJAT-49736 TaxID=2833582 RepID=UPI001BC9BE27|nr:DUF4279 domain-containing protein [Bacillus sp. FJAT-49736]MBS4172758.1 DUF4279 domain-containing protein [Bacillus sp. FJAT-49736]
MAYFSALGDEFPLEIVTNILGIQPTETYKKGDILNSPDNPNLTPTKIRRRTETDWTFSTGYQVSYDINIQLEIILKTLNGKTQQLKELKENYDLEYIIMVVIQVENNESPSMYLQKDIIDFVSAIQGEIHFDLYIIS